jgi:hypothetical protein
VGKLSKSIGLVAVGLIAAIGIARVPASSAPVSLQHIGDSKAGTSLASAVTEEISATQILRVGQDADEGWKLVLLTSNAEADGTTFYSVVLVRKQFDDVFDQYVFAFQGRCAAEQLQTCARDIVGRVQEPIAQFESNWRDLSQAPNGKPSTGNGEWPRGPGPDRP